MNIYYNVIRLLASYQNNLAKTGIYRYTHELLFALAKQTNIKVIPTLLEYSNILDAHNYNTFMEIPLFSTFVSTFVNVKSRYGLYAFYNRYENELKPRLSKKIASRINKLLKIFTHIDTLNISLPNDADIFHSTYDPLPNRKYTGRAIRVLTIHDLIAKKFPEYFTEHYWKWMDKILASIDPKHDWVICDSNCTRSDILNFRNLDPKKVITVPLAGSDKFHKVEGNDYAKNLVKKYNLSWKEYFISVATLEPRKNIKRLIESFALSLTNPAMKNKKLALIGAMGWGEKDLMELCQNISGKYKKNIISLGFASDNDIAYLYNGALGCAYISLYEGFGLPILEAMQCGIPVITSNVSSMPEVAGEAGIYIDHRDRESIKDAIVHIAENGDYRNIMSIKSMKQAATFSWERTANETIAVYETALKSR